MKRALLACVVGAAVFSAAASAAPSVVVRGPQGWLPGQFGALIRFHAAAASCAQSVTASVNDVERGGKGLVIYAEPLLIGGDLLGAQPFAVTYTLVTGPVWAPPLLRAGEYARLDFHSAATWTLRYAVSGCSPVSAPLTLKIKVAG